MDRQREVKAALANPRSERGRTLASTLSEVRTHVSKDVPELKVIQRAYELVKWTCQHTARFPRSHRFILGERLERRLYTLLETLIQARYSRDRRDLLRQANLHLEVLRFQFRLAHDLQCLRTNSYGFASELVAQVGAMVGGWSKASSPP